MVRCGAVRWEKIQGMNYFLSFWTCLFLSHTHLSMLFVFVRLHYAKKRNMLQTKKTRSSFTGVKAGGDRQELHEAIRVHSMAAGAVVKGEGRPNDLLDRIRADSKFTTVHGGLDGMVDPSRFVGRAPQQVDEFVEEHVNPVLVAHSELLLVENVDSVNV